MTKAILEHGGITAKVHVEKYGGTPIASVTMIFANEKPSDDNILGLLRKFEIWALARGCKESWFINAVDPDFVKVLEDNGYVRNKINVKMNFNAVHGHKKVIGD